MHERPDEIPEGDAQMRELEEELEHLEEDVEERGFFSKTMDMVKKLFTPAKSSGNDSSNSRRSE
jgi:hypothetical protein